jgi:hemerythrin-like domain-containing protein
MPLADPRRLARRSRSQPSSDCRRVNVDRARSGKQYVPLLDERFIKENNVLFRRAKRVMSEADDAYVTSRFLQVEQERGLSDQYAIYSSQASQWEKSFR